MVDLILVTLASSAVKSLVAGKALDRPALNEAAVAIINAILSSSDLRNERLSRMEAKLDHLVLQPFANALRSGLALLDRAAGVHASAAARDRDLNEARLRFIDAAAATPDAAGRVIALYHVALCALAQGNADECRNEMEVAANDALHALLAATLAANSVGIEFNRRLPEGRSMVDRFFEELAGAHNTVRGQALGKAVRQDLDERLKSALTMLEAVQHTRRALGVADHAACIPERMGDGHKEVTLSSSGRCEVDGLVVELLSQRPLVDGQSRFVDVHLSIRSDRLADLEVEAGQQPGTYSSSYPVPLPQTSSNPLLRLRALALSGKDLQVGAGREMNGWVRLPLLVERPNVQIRRVYPAERQDEWPPRRATLVIRLNATN